MADEPINEAQTEPLVPPDMTTVYLVLIKRGPIWTAESTEATERLQEQHLAYIRRMHREGKMIMAGPLTDGGELRGLTVFRVATLAEAKALAEADPAVQAGQLAVEVYTWLVSESVLPKKKET